MNSSELWENVGISEKQVKVIKDKIKTNITEEVIWGVVWE